MQSNCSTNIYPLFALLSHELMGAYNVVGFKARGGSLNGVNLSCFEVSQDNGSFIPISNMMTHIVPSHKNSPFI